MKKLLKYLLAVLISVLLVSSCSTKTVTTGFLNQHEARDTIPAGLPVTHPL